MGRDKGRGIRRSREVGFSIAALVRTIFLPGIVQTDRALFSFLMEFDSFEIFGGASIIAD